MSGARRSIAAQMSLPRAGDATCALSGPFGGSGVSSACERAGVAVALAAAAFFFGRPPRDRRSWTDWMRPRDPLNPIHYLGCFVEFALVRFSAVSVFSVGT